MKYWIKNGISEVIWLLICMRAQLSHMVQLCSIAVTQKQEHKEKKQLMMKRKRWLKDN